MLDVSSATEWNRNRNPPPLPGKSALPLFISSSPGLRSDSSATPTAWFPNLQLLPLKNQMAYLSQPRSVVFPGYIKISSWCKLNGVQSVHEQNAGLCVSFQVNAVVLATTAPVILFDQIKSHTEPDHGRRTAVIMRRGNFEDILPFWLEWTSLWQKASSGCEVSAAPGPVTVKTPSSEKRTHFSMQVFDVLSSEIPPPPPPPPTQNNSGEYNSFTAIIVPWVKVKEMSHWQAFKLGI